MSFCPNCGKPLLSLNPNFCPECGVKLKTGDTNRKEEPTAEITSGNKRVEFVEKDDENLELPKPTSFSLGRSLEQMTSDIFEKRGWTVKRNYHPPTRSGASTEIDVFIERGKIRKAIECKNFEDYRMVGVKDLRDFAYKLSDTGIAVGIAVTNSQFSEEAVKLADSEGIDLWDGEKLKENFFACSLGRMVNPSLLHDPTLPIRMDYETVSAFPLKNPDDIRLTSSVLLYQPYISVKFRLQISRKDPTGQNHKIGDQGTYFIDALDGDIINRERGTLEHLGGIFKSKQERQESKEDKLVSEDLETITTETKPVLRTSDYDVTIAEQTVSTEEAIKVVKYRVVEKNTIDEKYTIKAKGREETRTMKIVPKLNEVEIRGTRTVYVPKWILEYEAGSKEYTRRFLASSGNPINDELSKCNICTVLKKDTTAICTECGRTICEKHSFNEAGRWLCPDHISNELKEQLKNNSLLSKFSFWKK
jgi:uncharacterized Zn finger protein (UPF0148 family)